MVFTTRPWSALGYFPLGFHPNTIGLVYLLSSEVSFSCWFFYLLRKLETVYCVAVGWGGGRGASAGSAAARMPFTPEQGAGAWLAVAAASLWLARRAIAEAVRNALRPPTDIEPLPRPAFSPD